MAVDASNHQEEEEEERASVGVQNLCREEKGVANGVPDLPNGVVSGHNIDHCKDEQVAAGDIPVLSKEEKVSAGDTPDLHKEEEVCIGSVPDLRKEEEAVATGVQDLCKEEEEEDGCKCFKLSGKGSGHRGSRSREEGCCHSRSVGHFTFAKGE